MSQAKTIKECHKTIGYKLLSARGKSIYNTICRQMLEAGEIPFLFLDQLAMYAHSFADFLELDAKVKEEGHTLVSRDKRGDNRLYPNPAVKMRRDALADVMRIAKNFGFSQLDRERIKKAPADSADPLLQFIDKMNGFLDDDDNDGYTSAVDSDEDTGAAEADKSTEE